MIRAKITALMVPAIGENYFLVVYSKDSPAEAVEKVRQKLVQGIQS